MADNRGVRGVLAGRRMRRRAGALAASLLALAVLTQVSGGGSSAGAATPTCGGEVPPVKADGSAWVCTFNDEFSGLSLSSVWTRQQTANSAFTTGLSPYRACYKNTSSAATVSGGYLKLYVRKQTAFTCTDPAGSFKTQYLAGSVSTYGKFTQTYGRFEVRAKLPNTTQKGLQETLWLWPANDTYYAASGPKGCEPTGEIDFAEMYSLYTDWNIPFLHYCLDPNVPPNWTTNANIYTAYPAPNNQPGMTCSFDHTVFNTFTVIWQPGRITLYVNGQTCVIDNYAAQNLTSPAPFDQPFFVALTQALGIGDNGPTSSTPFPSLTEVDYVRVWR